MIICYLYRILSKLRKFAEEFLPGDLLMNQLERNQSILFKYIPEKAVPVIAEWIYQHDFKLRIKKSRTSKYGDYRPPVKGENHQITINYDMNKYAFLITLVHEIAHLTNWNKCKDRVKPHGDEWKHEYKELMKHFMSFDVFPVDVIEALKRYMSNPAASSCSDTNLLRVLKRYDQRDGKVLLEDVKAGSTFIYQESRYFIKGDQARKRIRCKEIKTNALYLFNPLTEVLVVSVPYICRKSGKINKYLINISFIPIVFFLNLFLV